MAAAELPPVDSVWDYQQPAESERRFRELDRAASARGSPGYRVEVLTQLARAVCLQRRFDEAHGVLDRAESMLAPDHQRPRLRCLLERSRIHNDTGQRAESNACLEQALAVGEASGEIGLTGDVLHMLVAINPGRDGVRWASRAIAFLSQHGDDEQAQRWRANIHVHLADRHEELGEHADGMASAREAYERGMQLGRPAWAQGPKVLWARLARLSGASDTARRLLDEVRETGYDKGWLFEEYGELHLAAGEPDAARVQFAQAYERFAADPWYPPSEAERLARIRQLGGC